MYMDKKKFDEVRQGHSTLLVLEDDASEAFAFVQEVMEAEAEALKAKCPYATKSIAAIESMARLASDMQREIDDNEFGQGD